MWFSEVDHTTYVLLLTVLVILGVFALLVFSSLPCTCKFFALSCLNRRTSRVSVSADGNRPYVIGDSPPESETYLYQNNPAYFAFPSGRRSGSGDSHPPPFTVVTISGAHPHLPCYYEQRKIKDEPPPSYSSLFPEIFESNGSSSASGKS